MGVVHLKNKRQCTLSGELGFKSLDDCEELETLGGGSYGQVVLCRDQMGELHAVKTIRRRGVAKQSLKRHGRHEATDANNRELELLRRVRHANIIHLQGVIEEDQHLHLVLEYCSEGTILGADADCPKFPPREVTYCQRVVRDVLMALSYLQSQRIAHLDVKPQNILISKEGATTKLADFGHAIITQTPAAPLSDACKNKTCICTVRQGRAGVDNNTLIVQTPGTPAFTAPECCRGQPYDGGKADIWALGMTLHALLTGHYYFLTNSEWTTYQLIVTAPPELQFLDDTSQDKDEGIMENVKVGSSSMMTKYFINGLLERNVQQRLSADEALAHPWVHQVVG